MITKENKQLQLLIEVEKKAEEILIDKNDIIGLDQRRHWDRESLAVLKRSPDVKVWTMFGPSIVKLTGQKARELLERDMKSADVEINKKRTKLKDKMNELRDLEYKDELKGFDLRALSHREATALKKMYGGAE